MTPAPYREQCGWEAKDGILWLNPQDFAIVSSRYHNPTVIHEVGWVGFPDLQAADTDIRGAINGGSW